MCFIVLINSYFIGLFDYLIGIVYIQTGDNMKTTFKIIWISLLSTIVKYLTHLIVDSNFQSIHIIHTPIIDIPYMFIIINIVVFCVFTLIFIGIKDHLPTSKLSKGVVYSLLISSVWFIYSIEPNAIHSLSDVMRFLIITFAPMAIYGAFLGYLSSERRIKMSLTKSYYGIFFVALLWIGFRVLYYAINTNEPISTNSFHVFLWLTLSGAVIGVVFSIFNKLIDHTMIITLAWMFNIICAVFVTYYIVNYSLNIIYENIHALKIAFDIISVLLGISLSNLVLKDKKKMRSAS